MIHQILMDGYASFSLISILLNMLFPIVNSRFSHLGEMKMTYSISEAANQLNLIVYTLRYYDKEGLTPFIERTPGGKGKFKDSDINLLKIIECMKSSGMSIKDIKDFIG